MAKKKFRKATAAAGLVLLMGLLAGCGGSGDEATITLKEVPIYPQSIAGESLEASIPGGMMGGNLAQYTTTDSYDEVLAFYINALHQYQPQVDTLTSDLGRQTAFSVEQENGIVSVTIQEFLQENQVNITIMGLGM